MNDTAPPGSPRGFPWAPSIVSSVIGSIVLAVGAVAARNASAAPRTFVLLLVGAGCGGLIAVVRVAPTIRLLALAAFVTVAGLASPSVLKPTGADDGTDVATSAPRFTSPAGSSSTTTTAAVTTTTSSGPTVTYLEDMKPVDGPFGGSREGPANISGRTYERSLVPGDLRIYDDTLILDYDLSRAYGSFQAVIGPRDDSNAETRIHFEVIADGKVILSERLGLGATVSPVLDVRGVLRLRLSATWDAGGMNDKSTPAWGDARVSTAPPG